MNKQEAIKRLKANRDMFVFEETKQALDMAIEALQDDWIPVSERLPKVGEYVLANVHDHCVDYNIIINKYEGQAFWRDGRITAWQPLPESYRPEGEDK